MTEGETFTLEDVQSSLSAETALVGWLDVDFPGVERNAWAYVVRSSGPVNWARLALIDGEESSSSGRLRGFRWGLADPQTPPSILDRDARALWRERIEPIEPFLEGVSELVVVPSGSVLGVPVEALISPDGAALGERFAVSYAPSATVHTWLRKRTATPTGREANRALLVGDPPFAEYQLDMVEEDYVGVESIAAQGDRISDSALARGVLSGNPGALSSLPRLAGTLSEVEGVAGLFPEAEVLLGESASEQELVELAQQGELKGFVVIHLATHALADDDHPDRSALILSQVGLPDPLEAALSGDRIHDGVVTATEIVRQWNLDAELVTLSACDTGLGKEVVGEGYIGLTQAFLQAGARSLLVSLWKVDDEATSLLMRRFYENWLAGADDGSGGSSSGRMSKAAALAEAKQWLRTRHDASGETPYDHPYYWSSFVLIGDPR